MFILLIIYIYEKNYDLINIILLFIYLKLVISINIYINNILKLRLIYII